MLSFMFWNYVCVPDLIHFPLFLFGNVLLQSSKITLRIVLLLLIYL